jgi:hypothetical protein
VRKGRAFWALLTAGLSIGGIAHAEMVIINGKAYEKGTKDVPGKDAAGTSSSPVAAPNSPGSSPVAVSDPLRVKKVFLFPSLDDLSGVLAPKLDETLSELFAKNPRFDLVRDAAVVRALSPDEAAYAKAATNQAVHREAARVTGADTTVLLRTHNAGGETEMTLEFRDANGDLLFSESGNVPGYSAMSARTNLAAKLFQNVLAKIPFEGTVTGRAANTLTLDLGSESVHAGDEVDLARIVSVQRHPLLRTIVGTDYVRTGKARITNVDKSISFAEVSEEFPGETVKAGAKVLISRNTVVRRPEREVPELENEPAPSLGRETNRPAPARRDRRAERSYPTKEKNPLDDRLQGEFDRAKQRYGQAGINLGYGSLTHSQTQAGNLTELSGGGFGGSLDGELWITREWIATISYGFQSANLAGSGITAGSTSWNKFELTGGYRIFPDAIAEGVEVTGSLGYQSQKFKIPAVPNTLLGAKGFSGIVLKLDGSVQFLPDQKVTGGFAFQPFASFTDERAPSPTDGGNVVSFNLAWNYRFADSFWARVGMQFDTANGSYEDGSSASEKRFAIGPGIYYSF